MRKKHALGIVVKDRWQETQKTLDSLSMSEQPRDSYDLFLIDNGSSTINVDKLKLYVKGSALPFKNVILLPELSISRAWNLFLLLAKDYQYRTKFDNDLVLRNTLKVSPPKLVGTDTLQSPSNPGAPISGPPIRGVGVARSISDRRKAAKNTHHRFLDHLEDFSKKNSVDLASLVPVSPEQTFASMYNAVITRQYRGMSYLFGACMMISQKCFEKIGYFHELLPRRIDIEYSQRALRNGLNIGYHPNYCVSHIGAANSTESHHLLQKKYAEATEIEQSYPIETYATTEWLQIEKRLLENTRDSFLLQVQV